MGRIDKLKALLLNRPDPMARVNSGFDRLHVEAGLAPLYTDRTVEVRRKEIITVMHDINEMEFEIIQGKKDKEGKTDSQEVLIKKTQAHNFKAFKLAKMFQLFFVTGDPWIRGLDNGQLSIAVSAFIEQYEDVGELVGFLNMLTSEAYELMHLAWQKIDVDVLPPMILSSQPLLVNTTQAGGVPRFESPISSMGDQKQK